MGQFAEYFRVGGSQHDHLPALRVAIGVAVPLIVLLAADRIDLTLYAVFGAFTGIYGRGEAHWLRFQHQVRAGLLIIVGVALGLMTAALDAGPWAIVFAATVVAAAGSVASDRWGIRPSGPFFPLFAFAACATIPAVVPALQALGVAGLTFLLALMIGAAGWVRPRHRDDRPGRRRTPTPDPRATALNSFRFGVATLVAGSIAVLSGLGHNYWAILAAVVPLAAATRSMRLQKAVWRAVGTLAGVGITAVLVALDPSNWQIVLMVIVLQFGAEMFVVRHYGIAMLFITPLALMMTQLAVPISPGQLIAERVLETVIGAAVGVAVVLAIGDTRRRRSFARG